MLDSETAKLLERKVFERMKLDDSNDSGNKLLAKNISKAAVRAAIITLQEYEKLNNESPQ